MFLMRFSLQVLYFFIIDFGSFMNVRTVEDEIIVDPVDAPEVIDDFELGQDEAVDIKDKEVNKQKLNRRIAQYKVESHSLLFILSCIAACLSFLTMPASFCRLN